MGRFQSIAAIIVLSAMAARGADLTLAVIRFRPEKKEALLEPLRTKEKSVSAFVADLQKRGACEILFQTNQPAALTGTNHIEKAEIGRVVLPGEEEPLPPITKIASKFDVTARAAGEKFALTCAGSIRWSPTLLDKSAFSVTRQSGTNSTVIRPFAPTGRTAGFEYPTLNETHFAFQKIVRQKELAISTTVAESGGQPPEMVIAVLEIQ